MIADGSHRQHHLRGGRKDWKRFFADATEDTPIAGSVELLDQFAPDLAVVLLTARPYYLEELTIDWLRGTGHRHDLLIMRDRRDGGLSSADFKRRSVAEVRDRGFVPRLALDDDPKNVDMFRQLGIATLYVYSGYYEE